MITNVVLDLDHTLIRSVTNSEDDLNTGSLKSHTFSNYVIYERPFLKDFIQTLSEKYYLSIWTAASKPYGEFIIKQIIQPYMKPNSEIVLFLHDEHCSLSESVTGILKHLDLLYELSNKYGFKPTFTRDNTVIVDDNEGILAQNNNVILIEPFEFDSHDEELNNVIRKIRRI